MAHWYVSLDGGVLLFKSRLFGNFDAGNAVGIDGKFKAGGHALSDGQFGHSF